MYTGILRTCYITTYIAIQYDHLVDYLVHTTQVSSLGLQGMK